MAGNNGAEVHDLTIEILKSIRDEIHTGFATMNDRIDRLESGLGARLDQTNARLDQTNARLDQTNGRLDQVVARLDLHSQALAKLIGEVGSLNVRFDNFLTGSHRDEHNELRARIERIEERLDKAG